MNILIIISSNEGTIASCAHQLYKGILNENPEHNLYVFCYGDYLAEGFDFGPNCFKQDRTNINKVSAIAWRTLFLRRIKRKYKIDFSISTQVGASVWNVFSGIGEYKTGIFHANLRQAKSASWKRYISFYFLYKTILKLLDKKIGVSKKIVKDIDTYIGGGELAYNIHDASLIRERSLQEIPYEYANLFHNPVILYVGRLYEEVKAPSRLLEAFVKFRTEVQDKVQLVYIGPDDNGTMMYLKNKAIEYGIDDCVHFLGKISNPYPYMKQARMLVSPSRDEGLPGVLIESMLLKVPCVVTNSSLGNWEILQCDDSYDSELKEIFLTHFGYITPNILTDEVYTIKMLAKGISECFFAKGLDFDCFDESRFDSKQVVARILEK